MKKLSILSALLLSAAVIFMGCKTPVNPEDDDKVDKTVDRVTLSDGDWTMKMAIQQSSANMEYTIKFSSTNNVGTAKSGSLNISMKTSDAMGTAYSTYIAMTPEQKESYKTTFKGLLEQSYASFGTIKNLSVDDENVKIEIELTSAFLTNYSSNLRFSNTFPSGTVIKTNSKKTKYEIKQPNSQGGTYNIYLSKD